MPPPIVDPEVQSAVRQKINGVVATIKESVSDLFRRMGDRFKSWTDVFTRWNKTRKKLEETHENTLSEVTQRAQSQLSKNSSIIIDTPEENIKRISLIVEVIALIDKARGGGSEGDNAYLEVEELVRRYLIDNKGESLDDFKKRAAKEAFDQYKINQKKAKQNSSDDLFLSSVYDNNDQSASKNSPDTSLENDIAILSIDSANARKKEDTAIDKSLTGSQTDNSTATVNKPEASMTSGQNPTTKASSENTTPVTQSDLAQQDRDKIVQEEKAAHEKAIETFQVEHTAPAHGL
jgi:hypothetical protein